MRVAGPRDADKAAEKLLKTAPTAEEALVLHRLLVGLRRDRHPVGGEVEQAALRMLFLSKPRLVGVQYHRMHKIVPSLAAQHIALEILEEALNVRRMTLTEALDIAYQKLA